MREAKVIGHPHGWQAVCECGWAERASLDPTTCHRQIDAHIAESSEPHRHYRRPGAAIDLS